MMERNKLGMLLFLGGEAIFFSLLILAYAYYHHLFAATGPAATVLNARFAVTAFFTFLLLSSSLTIWLAERNLRRGRHASMRWWLLATVLLGATFLVGQGTEYRSLVREGITLRTGLFGTTFYTLTGFHGFHVFVGLVILSTLFGLARHLRGPHSVALETASLYWHFVDLVWIVVFSVVYVWALFS
ncbi:MAG: heme-copper oxidase subunit III [Chloroflexota bacterium]|nr:heme-copper oxidase subunit III [Chloroflexota bacterium]